MGSTRQRRIVMGILLATLALSALFLAQGTTRLIAASLFALDRERPVASGRTRTSAAMRSRAGPNRKDPNAILARNIFDSELGDLTRMATAEGSVDGGEEGPALEFDPNAPPPECQSSVRLVGAVVSEHQPEWSFAAMLESGDKAMLYRTGMKIAGHELLAIQLNRVILVPSDGRVCQVEMFNPNRPTTPKSSRPQVALHKDDGQEPPKRRSREGGIPSSELESGIEKVSDTEYNIQRGLVTKVLANQAELMRTARIIPHEQNGRVVGVKLYGIRRNSLLGKLGINNGDMLRTINGYDMTAPDSALEAYARLQSADHLTVAIERRGKPMNLNFNIQ